MSDALFDQAAEILRRTDRGTCTVPTHGLHPFQWNDPAAAEADTLLRPRTGRITDAELGPMFALVPQRPRARRPA